MTASAPAARAEFPRPDSPEAEALRRALERAQFLSISIDVGEAIAELAHAQRLARRLGDRAALARAHGIAATCHYYRGDYVSALASAIDAVTASAGADPAARLQAMLCIANAFLCAQDAGRSAQAARRAARLAARARDAQGDANALAVLGCALGEAGRFEEALATLRRARAAFRRQGDGERASAAAVNAGHVLDRHARQLERQGDVAGAARRWRHARRYYRQALDAGRPRVGAVMAQASLAACEMRLGNLGESRTLLAQAARVLEPRDPPRIAARVTWLIGEVERRLGRADEAARLLADALAAADTIDSDDLAAECRESLAALAADRGDRRQAQHWAKAARAERKRRRDAISAFRREMRPLWDRYLRQEPD